MEELRKIEKDFYRNLCDYGVETLKLLTISRGDLAKRIVYEDVSEVEAYAKKNQSIVLFASHNFNWEWLLAGGSLHLPVHVDFVYQPQNSKLFDRFSLVSRTRFGSYPIQRREVARESFKRRHILRGIAIVADQYPGHRRNKRHFTTFLNQETAFFYGAAQLAAAMQYPVMYGAIRKVRRGFYVCRLVKISEPPYEHGPEPIIESYAKALEKLISERPSEWLWSHNRWKSRHLKNMTSKTSKG